MAFDLTTLTAPFDVLRQAPGAPNVWEALTCSSWTRMIQIRIPQGVTLYVSRLQSGALGASYYSVTAPATGPATLTLNGYDLDGTQIGLAASANVTPMEFLATAGTTTVISGG